MLRRNDAVRYYFAICGVIMRKKDDIIILFDGYDNEMIGNFIDKYINGHNAERNRKILKRRIIDGINYEPLSEEFNLSTRQTQNIIYDGIFKLRCHLLKYEK